MPLHIDEVAKVLINHGEMFHGGKPRPTATPATSPPAVWYDEPPFEKINKTNLCWVENIDSPQAVYWSDATNEWWVWIVDGAFPQPLNGRRVSPIVKPQEPTQ